MNSSVDGHLIGRSRYARLIHDNFTLLPMPLANQLWYRLIQRTRPVTRFCGNRQAELLATMVGVRLKLVVQSSTLMLVGDDVLAKHRRRHNLERRRHLLSHLAYKTHENIPAYVTANTLAMASRAIRESQLRYQKRCIWFFAQFQLLETTTARIQGSISELAHASTPTIERLLKETRAR